MGLVCSFPKFSKIVPLFVIFYCLMLLMTSDLQTDVAKYNQSYHFSCRVIGPRNLTIDQKRVVGTNLAYCAQYLSTPSYPVPHYIQTYT
jgi:hypothetical protein